VTEKEPSTKNTRDEQASPSAPSPQKPAISGVISGIVTTSMARPRCSDSAAQATVQSAPAAAYAAPEARLRSREAALLLEHQRH